MSENSLSFDKVLGLCQHQHRRIVLGALAEERRSLTLDDLTNAVLEYNHQTPLPAASADLLAEIRLSLYQVHLPKLASAGLVTFDSERRLVEATEQLDRVEPTLFAILAADPTLDAPIGL